MMKIAEEMWGFHFYLSRFVEIDSLRENRLDWASLHDRFVCLQNYWRTCLSGLWWFCWWLQHSFTTAALSSATTVHRNQGAVVMIWLTQKTHQWSHVRARRMSALQGNWRTTLKVYSTMYCSLCSFHFTMRCTIAQSVVLRLRVVRPSVCLWRWWIRIQDHIW